MAKRPGEPIPRVIPDPTPPGTKTVRKFFTGSNTGRRDIGWLPEYPPKKINWESINAAYGHDVKSVGTVSVSVKAVKKASLNNKKYNVGTSTAADPTVNPVLYGGGGGGVMVTPEKESFLSSIPSIVWIILAVGGAWYVLKSSGKR